VPVSAETLRLLMDAGIEGDDLLRIVESIDQTPKQRSANAERQARFRAKNKGEGVISNVISNVTKSVTSPARVEGNSSNLEISNKNNKKTAREHLSDFKASLLDLGEERLEALVLHRKAKNAALTGYAAKLFRKDCADSGISTAAGADMAMSRGWITVKAEWLRDKQRSTAPPPREPRNAGERAFLAMQGRKSELEPTENLSGRLGQSDGRRQIEGSGIARQFAR
jgi:hypothetical protein